jgi:predicted RNase H-like HicB family nuclease/predicted RNA binding protein YcfA (HicA-like mRNA interferase family)
LSREAKLLERMRRDPRDVRPDELFDVLRAEGVSVRRHGSHVGLQRGDVRMTFALPHGGENRVKTPYVVEALKRFGLGEAGEVEEAARRLHADVDVRASEDGGYVAELGELPGCMTHGDTRAEAIANLEEAKACWLALGETRES